MLRIEKTVLINRPAEEVWDFVGDLKNSPGWTRSGSELRQTSEGPVGVGTTIESRRRLFGRDVKSQSLRVVRYQPIHEVVFEGSVPLLGHPNMRLLFEPTAAGTRLTRIAELDVRGPLRLLQPVLARLLSSVFETEMTSIKRLIEARAQSQ
jgi:uncharacterized protein YndB with AHSA1/START domain